MASPPDVFDFSEVILNLDQPDNIGHPCWEWLLPSLNIVYIYKLFAKYNEIFFDGVLARRVEVVFEQNMERNAGQTIPPGKEQADQKIIIQLNEEMVPEMLRKEVIETLLASAMQSLIINENCRSHLKTNVNGCRYFSFTARNDSRIFDGDRKRRLKTAKFLSRYKF